jgi:hypothetical protein
MTGYQQETRYKRRGMLVRAMAIGAGLLLVLGIVHLNTLSKEYPLPDRTLGVPAPKLLLDATKAQAGAKGLVVYAKEPVSFNSPAGEDFYLLRGYVGVSQAPNAPVITYVRAKDPGEDPACKVLPATLTVQNEIVDSSVYVCEEGRSDLKAEAVNFADTRFSSFSFCSLISQGKFWIGIRWSPLFSYPLTFSFANMTAYGPLPSVSPSFCPSVSRSL